MKCYKSYTPLRLKGVINERVFAGTALHDLCGLSGRLWDVVIRMLLMILLMLSLKSSGIGGMNYCVLRNWVFYHVISYKGSGTLLVMLYVLRLIV